MKFCVAILVLGWAAATLQGDDPKFETIFDGKSLSGWTVTPAQYKAAWSVSNGVIRGTGDKGRSYLEFENKELADFELKFRYRFPGKGNSGVSIRAIPDPTGKRGFQSYHADLGHVGIGKQILGAWDFHTPGRKEHACFRGDRLVIDEDDRPSLEKIKDPVTIQDIRKHDWNAVHVVARGNNFKLFIDGKLSSEFTEHLPEEKRLRKGAIQLQLHDPGMVVEFRDIRLKILK